MTFVLDNSVVMRWLFGDGSLADLAYADRILIALGQENGAAVVPGFWPLEVGNVIARAEAKGLITEARSARFLATLNVMAISVDGAAAHHTLSATLQLARRFKLSSYDASYLELTLRLGLPIATLDADLLRAASTLGVESV